MHTIVSRQIPRTREPSQTRIRSEEGAVDGDGQADMPEWVLCEGQVLFEGTVDNRAGGHLWRPNLNVVLTKVGCW
jgi:hypothetical protein